MPLSRENRPGPHFRSVTGRVLRGVRRTIQVPAPAAGVDWSVQVPGGRKWRILTGFAHLVTSAAAGTRLVGYQILDGAVPIFDLRITNGWGPTVASDVTFMRSDSLATNVALNGGSVALTIPDMELTEGMVFGTATQGILAADQWSLVALHVEELFESNGDFEVHRELEEQEVLEALSGAAQPPPGG